MTNPALRQGPTGRSCSLQRDDAAVVELRRLRAFSSCLTDHPEQKGCGRRIRRGGVGSAQEVLDVTTNCRSKWLCPTCGYTAWWQQAKTLEDRLDRWTAAGGAAALLTLTQSHTISDSLEALWDRLEEGWAAVTRGSGWTADKEAHGVCGYVRITEVLHHPMTGWNVHLHVVLLLRSTLDSPRMEELRASVAQRFARPLARLGGGASLDGQDLRPVTGGTSGALANYLFKGTTIRWTENGSRTPLAILSDLESTGEGLALWDELTAATSGARRVQVRPSNHIDSICDSGPGTSLDKRGSKSTITSGKVSPDVSQHNQQRVEEGA